MASDPVLRAILNDMEMALTQDPVEYGYEKTDDGFIVEEYDMDHEGGRVKAKYRLIVEIDRI